MWEFLTRQIGACLFLLVFSAIVRAESGLVGDNQMIGLNEAVARTLARNPELVAFGYQLQAQDRPGIASRAGTQPRNELYARKCTWHRRIYGP